MNKLMGQIKKLLKSRTLLRGANSVILAIVVIGIALLANVLIDMAQVKWDLTPNKLFSLTATTKDVLEGLDKDVEIVGLFDEIKDGERYGYKESMSLLEKYSTYSHIDVKYIDPDKNPGMISQLDPENIKDIRKGDFIIKSGDKSKKLVVDELFQQQMDEQTFQIYTVGSKAEQAFTGAIRYVTAEKTPTVYFIQGHGEINVDTAYTKLRQYLEMNNYEAKSLNLLTEQSIPEDAEMIIFASPQRDLLADEKNRVENYLKNGGKGVFLFDPLESGASFTEFNDILGEYNLALNYDKVKENDENRHIPNNQYDIVPDIIPNNIIPSSNEIMILPRSRSIKVLSNQKDYITVTPLLRTSSQAVGEQIGQSAGGDNQGPLDLAVAVEHIGSSKPSKILVMGNATFMTDSAVNVYGTYSRNGALFFLNALSWIEDKKEEILIEPKIYQSYRIQISATQANIMGVLTIILLPLIILGSGMFVYLRRRHL